MPARTLQGELNCFVPAFVDFDLGNVFGSNPDYDEAFGPPRDDCFVPIDEVTEEDGEGCDTVRQIEDPTDRFNRLFTASLDDPLADGETEADVLRTIEEMEKDHSPVNRVEFGYGHGPRYEPELWVDYSDDAEYTKPKLGAVTVERKKTVWVRQGKKRVPRRIDTEHNVVIAARRGKQCMREPLAPCTTKPGRLSLHR